MSINQNNAKIVATCNQRLTALKKFVTATKATMPINGQPKKLADLIAVYQAAIDTRASLTEQHAAYEKALADRDDADTTRVATDAGLMHWVVTTFGAGSTQAKEFGFLPRKVTEKSAATKALAAKKAGATREARGTKGKRQKAPIKGSIVAPAVPAEPAVTTSAAASPAAAAVPATSNGASNGAPSPNGVAASH